jgi:hypothetical protein
MPPALIFLSHLILGYVAWILILPAFVLPKLSAAPRADAHRAIAALHAFRFFGLVFILPGVVGPGLPAAFASAAAYGDLATGLLALLALATFRIRPLFWAFVAAFNLVGVGDLATDYALAVRLGLPEVSGQLGAAYVIPIVYVPLLMLTHMVAFWFLLRPAPKGAGRLAPA